MYCARNDENNFLFIQEKLKKTLIDFLQKIQNLCKISKPEKENKNFYFKEIFYVIELVFLKNKKKTYTS